MGTWISPKDGDGGVVPSASTAALQEKRACLSDVSLLVVPNMGDTEVCCLVTAP